jgi:ribosomal protein S10
MQAHKQTVTVPEDHQLEIRLPADFPAGPAEIIVLASPHTKARSQSQQDMLQALQELRNLHLTPEEERVLDEFEEFQQQQPVKFSSLIEEE